MNLTFFQGFVTGALVAMLAIFLLMAWTLGKMKNENQTARKANDEFNQRSLELMKERNTQYLITHQYLKIIGLHLGELVRIYNSR